MKIKQSQLKSFIKHVVRESISEHEYEQLLNEVSPPGKKAERMIGHVKASLRKSHPEWDEDKITSVAIATGWKAHNKGSVEESGQQIPKGKLAQLNPKIATSGKDKKLGAPTGKLPSPIRKANEAGLTSEIGAESKDSAMDDVVRLVIKRGAERGLKDPQKIAQVAGQLFKHQMGWDADPQALQSSVEKNMPMGEEFGDEHGIPTDGGEEIPSPEGEHGYDEKEEILLIKVMKKVAEKLEAMHAGEDAGVADPEVEIEPEGGDDIEGKPFAADEPSEEPEGGEEPEAEEEPSENPFGKSDEEPEAEEPEEPKDDDDDKDKVDEEAYKTVAPRSYEVQQDNKALTIQTDPKVNEASYKVVSKKQAQVQKDDQAKKVQTEPDVNENHKVQARSYMTSNDTANDPQNVRDPEVPMAEAKKAKGKFKSFPACHHSKYTLRDDGKYECSNCGKIRS